MNIRKHAKSLIGIMRRREDKTWTTIHPRWDMELFSYLFSKRDEEDEDYEDYENEIYDRKSYLANACKSIF